MFIDSRIASIVSPCPSASPTVLLRLCFDEHVAIRSPIPASPANVAGVAADRHAEPGHLRQPAGDQRRPGVVPEAHPLRHAGRDGDDVLDDAGDLAADDVGVRVHAQRSVG